MDISGDRCLDCRLHHSAYLSSLKRSTSSLTETSASSLTDVSTSIRSNDESEHPIVHRPIIVPELPSRIREGETNIRSCREICSGCNESSSPLPINFNNLSGCSWRCERIGESDEPRSNALKLDQAIHARCLFRVLIERARTAVKLAPRCAASRNARSVWVARVVFTYGKITNPSWGCVISLCPRIATQVLYAPEGPPIPEQFPCCRLWRSDPLYHRNRRRNPKRSAL